MANINKSVFKAKYSSAIIGSNIIIIALLSFLMMNAGYKVSPINLFISFLLSTLSAVALIIPIIDALPSTDIKIQPKTSWLFIIAIYAVMLVVLLLCYAGQSQENRMMGYFRYFVFAAVGQLIVSVILRSFNDRVSLYQRIGTGYIVVTFVLIPFFISDSLLALLSTWLAPLFITTIANIFHISFTGWYVSSRST